MSQITSVRTPAPYAVKPTEEAFTGTAGQPDRFYIADLDLTWFAVAEEVYEVTASFILFDSGASGNFRMHYSLDGGSTYVELTLGYFQGAGDGQTITRTFPLTGLSGSKTIKFYISPANGQVLTVGGSTPSGLYGAPSTTTIKRIR